MFNVSEILPYLFIGTYREVRAPEKLRIHGITHVLNVRESCRFDIEKHCSLLHRPLDDNGGSALSAALPDCIRFIDSARDGGGGCLVHCHAGVNRSVSVVLGYLMIAQSWTLREAFAHVLRSRPEMHPHAEYVRQLRAMETVRNGSTTLPESELLPLLMELAETD